MEIYSIGFTQKSASEFFGTSKANGIERLLDVRLNNTSQLAEFTLSGMRSIRNFGRPPAAFTFPA
jgi:uncharacterized protein (DUF488 family)